MHHYITWQCQKCGKIEKKNQGTTPPNIPQPGRCPQNNNSGHIWKKIEHVTK
jgi:hypothetical protein